MVYIMLPNTLSYMETHWHTQPVDKQTIDNLLLGIQMSSINWGNMKCVEIRIHDFPK